MWDLYYDKKGVLAIHDLIYIKKAYILQATNTKRSCDPTHVSYLYLHFLFAEEDLFPGTMGTVRTTYFLCIATHVI